MPTWSDTRLWRELKKSTSPERPIIEGLLQQWMPDIEKVLSAGTASLDFTLHDEEHSFRVAAWMAKIVPEDVLPKLSVYELALLLLAAYLHDIGMTPEQARVQRHWRHLVFGALPEEPKGLSQEEAAELQRWLDDERGGVGPPLARAGRPTEDELRRAAELITYYARHKHNDWSAEWIRQNATGRLGSYEGWVEDLVLLCKSHHEGYADLREDRFDPQLVGRHGDVVHLRYLACVLRVADILDVDPERTPHVLFQHRDIRPGSVLYWWKDHDFVVRRDVSTLVVQARPRSPVVEKAIRDTAEWIRLELETCARLSREKRFSQCPFQAAKPLPHEWDFPESLYMDVRPRNDDYVYIDGAFRPDTAKLLELLSGIRLYKEPLAAVRELLQNAFDAVKERIALGRLEGDPTDPGRIKAITALQRVELRFEERERCFWLHCSDTGVGMTRAIIEKYLLVSGSARRHDILDLERRCEAAGFRLGRTGQFGIGVLSYFMLADRVELGTRRSFEHGDEEPHGWRFETEGVGSFGELRKESRGKPGTTVSLRLRQGVVENREEFLSRLQKYLLDALVRLPCSFQLAVEGETSPRLGLEVGWQPRESRLLNDFLDGFEANQRAGWQPLLVKHAPRSHLERFDRELSEWAGVAKRFREAILWETEEGELINGLGCYRLAVPFFELPGGRSALFFDIEADRRVAKPLPLVSANALALWPELQSSFQGMKVEERAAGEPTPLFFLGEVDWESPRAGRIVVDRTTYTLSAEAEEAVACLKACGEELMAKVLARESEYAELNARLCAKVPPPAEAWWFVNANDQDGQEGLSWERLSLPALSSTCFDRLPKALQARASEQLVSIAQALSVFTGIKSRRSFRWEGDSERRVAPTRPAIVRKSPLVIIPQYGIKAPGDCQGAEFFEGEFPLAWGRIAALGSNRVGEPWLWNRSHPLVKAIKPVDLEWFSTYDHLQVSEDLLQERGRAVLCMTIAVQGPWGIFRERAEDYRAGFWHDLWERMALSPAEIVTWVQQTDGKGFLRVFGSESTETILATDPRIADYLPDPGDEWKLTIDYKEGSAESG